MAERGAVWLSGGLGGLLQNPRPRRRRKQGRSLSAEVLVNCLFSSQVVLPEVFRQNKKQNNVASRSQDLCRLERALFVRIVLQWKEGEPGSPLLAVSFILTLRLNFKGVAPEFLLLVVNAESGPRAWFYPRNFLLPFVVCMSLHT